MRYPLGPIAAGGALRTIIYDVGDRIKSIVHTGASLLFSVQVLSIENDN